MFLRSMFRRSGQQRDYSVLPTSKEKPLSAGRRSPTSSLTGRTFGFTKRYTRRLITLVFLVVIAIFVFSSPPPPAPVPFALPVDPELADYPPYPETIERSPRWDSKPPLYERYTEWENNLPQNNISLPFPEGPHAKYVYFANHQRYAGWGNVLQETILNYHLAYSSGRSFVFDNYTWDINGPVYAGYNGKWIPSRIPISTMVAGPLGGYPIHDPHNPSQLSNVPRSVSKNFFYEICPPEKRVSFSSDVVRLTLPPDPTAKATYNAWVKKLSSMEERCVEVADLSPQLFDIWILGSDRVHGIWPSLSKSPIITQFRWSPLIQRLFFKNYMHFYHSLPSSEETFSFLRRFRPSALLPTPPPPPKALADPEARLPVIALHLRRGDFEEHCEHLANWSSTYTGFNSLPALPDRFVLPHYDPETKAGRDKYLKEYIVHCWPERDDIVRRVREVLTDWYNGEMKKVVARLGGDDADPDALENARKDLKKRVKRVYLMTNGKPGWLKSVKRALVDDARRSSGTEKIFNKRGGKKEDKDDWEFEWEWEGVSTSRDLDIGWEEKYVAQALDMYVGQRAEVFVGNGFSSLTANIVLMRLAKGQDASNTRFW